jgi:4-amino-4-deoxy-L-arabinose transferase-like glycosyltransferase
LRISNGTEIGKVDITILHSRESGEKGVDWKVLLGLLLLLAFILRIFLVFFPEVIYNDGTEYVRSAKLILSGNWGGSKVPPLYPALIALVSLFTSDFELAGIWVSVILGTLVILPVFYLGKEIFDEKVGVLSALFAVVQPFLYMSSGSVLTESAYHLLLCTAVLFSWKAFSSGKFYSILLFSLFTTFSYLTKPEAIGFLFVFSVWVGLVHSPVEKRSWARKIGIISAAILAFLVFSSPYLIQIRKETGRWGISKKLNVMIGSLSEEEETPSIWVMRKKKALTLSSLVKNPLPVLGKVGTGLLESIYKFQQVYNPLLFLPALLGWVFLFKKKNSCSLKGSFFLMSHLVFFFGFVLPFFFITRRYTSQMISISIPWAAFGFLGLTEWLHQRWGRSVSLKKFSVPLLLFILIGLFIQGRVIHTRERRVIKREVGLWMKENLLKGSKVMSRLPQEAFYAEFPWVRMPEEEYDKIMGEAQSKGVRYLLIEEDVERISPNFLARIRQEDLVLVRDFNRKDQKITIFKINERDEKKR